MNAMTLILKEIKVRNFKSLQKLDFNFENISVIIGKSGAGKTNFIEVFKFIKKIILDEGGSYLPHVDWWNVKNIAWKGNVYLPISISMIFDYFEYNISYDITVSLVGGNIRLEKEEIIIKDIINVVKIRNELTLTHNLDYLDSITEDIEQLRKGIRFQTVFRIERNGKPTGLNEDIIVSPELPQSIVMAEGNKLLRWSRNASYQYHNNTCLMSTYPHMRDAKQIHVYTPALTKTAENGEKSTSSLFSELLEDLKFFINNISVVIHPDIKKIRDPSPIRQERILSEDGTNLNTILFNWFVDSGGKFPEIIQDGLNEFFPDLKVTPSLSEQGQVFLKIRKKEYELDPPSLPDGLYKLLLVLSAIEQKPSILAIDELENCLHAKLIDYILDELESCNSIVVVTTHSTMIVDITKLENLYIFDSNIDGTFYSRISNPEKMREKLTELGLTQSESWIYGDLTRE